MPEQTNVKEIDITIIVLKIIEQNIWAGVLCFISFFAYKLALKHLELKEDKVKSIEELEEEVIEPLQEDVKELEERVVRLELTKSLPQD